MIQSFLLGRAIPFTATGSIAKSIEERDPARRSPLATRLRHVLFECGAWFHLAVVAALLLAVAYRTSCIFETFQGRDRWIELLREVAWPYPQWLTIIMVFLVRCSMPCFPRTCPTGSSSWGREMSPEPDIRPRKPSSPR